MKRLVFALVLLSACTRGEARDAAAEGIAFARGGQLELAAARFDRALELEPDEPTALYNGGLADLALGRIERGRVRLDRFVAARPDDPAGHFARAQALELAGEREAALSALRRAVELGSDDLDRMLGGFESLRTDLRFVQLAASVAQRTGRRLPRDERGRLLVGDKPLKRLEFPTAWENGSSAASPIPQR